MGVREVKSKQRKPEVNHAKKKSKKVTLTGDERYWIQMRIEKLKVGERSGTERNLLSKVV